MDAELLAWARAAASRGRGRRAPPPLWLFTDQKRLPDPCAAVARLPKGLCGVVLRHDADPERTTLGRRLAAICRQRRLVLVVAGDWRLAASLRAGLHLRGGNWPGGSPRPRAWGKCDGVRRMMWWSCNAPGAPGPACLSVTRFSHPQP